MQKQSRGRAAIATLLAAMALAGCAVAPAYQPPKAEVPAAFKEAAGGNWKAAQPAEEAHRGQWWTIFRDPVLDEMQERAGRANQNLKAAAARLVQARARLREARADLYPSVDGGVGPTRQRPSPASRGLPADASTSPSTLWRAQATVSYEVDLFGRVAASVDAASAQAEQSEALFRSVQLALQADVAQAYFLVRELDAGQQLYEGTVALRERTLSLIQRRYDEGDISELDLARARTELASARSEALDIARQRAAAEHALAILLGEAPANFSLPPRPLGRLAVSVPPGLPSGLLERRPDIAAAERAMAAANARVGLAQTAFFPRLELTGALGYESAQLGDLFNWSSRTFIFGPLVGTMLTLPIFDGGRREAGLQAARAAYEEEAANYRQTVLNAFKEVEDNLANLRILGDQYQAQDQAVESAARAARLSQIQYREGSVSYLDVIDADRSVLQQRRVATRLDGELARSTVNLIRALGGGWDGFVAEQPPAAALLRTGQPS
ncbi:efflux transporter outer membrane subunit [Pigmentiphaga sp. NML080357]|uniref:efflux transporter outer membrane subunit n=1 Tax=Pigmentiphaga sp. NML080357 TaxID=2008675 RepID=UPI001E42DE57|nr:efflux transporter outer membrane subunit [Pigmentiphaga sp. NML080357]